ncbi:50S ribosomal protein L32, partial [bacterium]|nr:50S ribosomal protein L32 [bacterium]
RRDKRRTHWKLKPPTLATCQNCQEVKLAHHLCLNCGYYHKKEIIKVAV